MKTFIRIAGKRILIEAVSGAELSFFRGFRAEEGDAFMTVRAELPKEAAAAGSSGESLFGLRVSRTSGSHPWRFDPQTETGEYLLASRDFADCRLISEILVTGKTGENAREPRWRGLILGALAARGALSGMLLLHASAAEWRGRAVVFTAPSGTGKTTQAELWAKYAGARILNGDKVFISREEDGFYAWGSPWSGSSPYRVNRGAPLAALIVLEKGPENDMKRLSGEEILSRFTPNLFLPYWEEEILASSLGTLDELVRKVPVFSLTCRPDEDAVLLAKETVFGDAAGVSASHTPG